MVEHSWQWQWPNNDSHNCYDHDCWRKMYLVASQIFFHLVKLMNQYEIKQIKYSSEQEVNISMTEPYLLKPSEVSRSFPPVFFVSPIACMNWQVLIVIILLWLFQRLSREKDWYGLWLHGYSHSCMECYRYFWENTELAIMTISGTLDILIKLDKLVMRF